MAQHVIAAATAGNAAPIVVKRRAGLSRQGRAFAFVLAVLLLIASGFFAWEAGATPIIESPVSSGRTTTPTTSGGGTHEGWIQSGFGVDGAIDVVDPQEATFGPLQGLDDVAPAADTADATDSTAADADAAADGSDSSGVDAAEPPACVATNTCIGNEFSGDTTHVDWQGNPFVTTDEESFIGDRVIVPGDRVHRTMYLQNDGPTAAVLELELEFTQEVFENTANLELAKGVEMFWSVTPAPNGVPSLGSPSVSGSDSFHNLYVADGTTEILSAQVSQGERVAVTLGFSFSDQITEHYSAGELSKLLSFRLLAAMREVMVDPGVPIPPTPTPDPDPSPDPDPTPTPDPGEQLPPEVVDPTPGPEDPNYVQPGGPSLPVTGASIFGTLSLAGALGIFGWLLITAKRRRCEVCDATLKRSNRENVCEGAPQACELNLAVAAATA